MGAAWGNMCEFRYVKGHIEVYLNADPQNARYEVWIPVTKKKEK